jgi:hypothetical protein
MHDWVFAKASIDWERAVARLEFNWDGKLKVVRAVGFSGIHLPRQLPWGPSASVNRCDGPTRRQGGEYGLAIEMQSGDTIEITARQFEMPSA